MDRQKDEEEEEVDEGRKSCSKKENNTNNQSTTPSSTTQEGRASSSSQLTTITNDGDKLSDNNGKIQNIDTSTTPSSCSTTKNPTKDPPLAMSGGQNTTTTSCSQEKDNNTINNTSSICVVSSATCDNTTSSSKTTVPNTSDDSCTTEEKGKVLEDDSSVKDGRNVNKSGISSSSSVLQQQETNPQQVKGKDISIDGEIDNERLVGGNCAKDSVVVITPTTITISNKPDDSNPDVKMTSVGGDVGTKRGGGTNQDDGGSQQQDRPVPAQVVQNVVPPKKEEKNPSVCPTTVDADGGEIMPNQQEITRATLISSSSVVETSKDDEGRKIIDVDPTQPKQPGGEDKTTCPPGSSDNVHLSKDEGNNLISTKKDDDNQQVKVTGDDGSLNQVAQSEKNQESSPVKPARPAAVNPSNPVHKTLPNVPSGGIGNTALPESTLQQPASTPPPPPGSKLEDKTFSSDSTDVMKPSTDTSLESAGNKLPSVNPGSGPAHQTDTSGAVSSSPLKQPLEKKADDDASRVTAISAPTTQTVQSSTDDSSKRFPGRDLAGASQTVEHSSSSSSSGGNDKSSTNPCVQGQDDIDARSAPSKGGAELTNLSTAGSEVPKKSEQQDLAVRTATLSLGDNLGDNLRDADETSSKRSESDSQDVTPSDSLSIPSDRDLECVDIASLGGGADNDAGGGVASLKVTKDGASSSSSSSVLSIYHLKWIHFKSKKIPVITQNENGPCPLLAIMNVLLLQGRVTLESGLELITSEQLMDHLDECILENVPKTASEDVQLNYQQNMQDGMAVIHKLQTGLDVNVRFTGVQDFEYTTECIIFDLLGISLYHGWLVDPQSVDVVSAIAMCSYNQLVEKIIVQKTSEDFTLFTEATIAENFLEKTASQLTYHGLCELSTTVKEGELCVFFRNNHFSTLYRHKNELFLLVTDQGFLNEFNVVWETLSSVEGDCYFVDAEFNTYTKPDPVSGNSVVTPPVVPIGSHQQIDQDYLVALSLDREQQLQREAWATHAGPAGVAGSGGSGAGAAVPDPLKTQHVQLTDLELAKKLQDEENQRAGGGGGGAAAATSAAAAAASRRNPRAAAEACTSSGTRRTRDREKDKDSCLIL